MTTADGSWNVDIASPLGTLHFVLDLAESGDEVTGRAVGELGEFVVEDGRAGDDGVTFSVDADAPLPVKLALNLKIIGDSLRGTAKAGPLTARVTGTRAARD